MIFEPYETVMLNTPHRLETRQCSEVEAARRRIGGFR